MNPRPQLKKGLVFGKWVLVSRLGRGGNGEVWRAKNAGGDEVAIKILAKLKPTAYNRFKDEVQILETARSIVGVVPLLDKCVPDQFGTSQAWYAMPIGLPFMDWACTQTAEPISRAIAQLADTLGQLHNLNIVHRDIKPSNLLVVEGRPHVGDFGLVDFPDKVDLTGKNENLGPKWTMAPEVKREGIGLKDARPADVYSLAKTLWIALTKNVKGFDGQYSGNGTLGLKGWFNELFLDPLDELLALATDNNADQRPTMSEFADRLRHWCDLERRFPARNGLEWKLVLSQLFPIAVPTRARWTSMDEIVGVMNLLGSRNALNHLFFPTGGGLDLTSARPSTDEPDCIEFETEGQTHLCRPESLSFESFAFEPQWNYFRLEAALLQPSGVYRTSDLTREEVLRLGDTGEYVSRSYWDEGEYGDAKLPEGSRVVTRFLRGAFVIFQKMSAYNKNSGTYDARHNKLSAEQFRQYIADIVQLAQNQQGRRMQDPDS